MSLASPRPRYWPVASISVLVHVDGLEPMALNDASSFECVSGSSGMGQSNAEERCRGGRYWSEGGLPGLRLCATVFLQDLKHWQTEK